MDVVVDVLTAAVVTVLLLQQDKRQGRFASEVETEQCIIMSIPVMALNSNLKNV